MLTDRELLQRYADNGSEDAFREILHRHTDLVYGAALRTVCGNVALAKDVTQSVFIALAAKRRAAGDIAHLAAWLYGTTRYSASHAVRAERRRQEREAKALLLNAPLLTVPSNDTADIPAEFLDDALDALSEEDRQAILLRFFERHSFAAIGLALQTSEDAARVRVARALEKLRVRYARNGINSSAAAIGAALTSHVVAAPAGLVSSISTAVTTTSVATTTGFFMATKTFLWVPTIVAALSLGYSGYLYHKEGLLEMNVATLAAERATLTDQLSEQQRRSRTLEQRVAIAEARTAEFQQMRASPLPTSGIQRPTPAKGSPDASTADALARLTAAIEAGMPITGVIVLMVDGKPQQHPVQFTMGTETRITGDDGTYFISPTLNPNGGIRYKLELADKSGLGERKRLSTVVAAPWGGFQLAPGAGKTMAFDSDIPNPNPKPARN